MMLPSYQASSFNKPEILTTPPNLTLIGAPVGRETLKFDHFF